MSTRKKTSIWEKEILYLLTSPPDEFCDNLFTLPHVFIEEIVKFLVTDGKDLLDIFNRKINYLKSNMDLPNAKHALRKLNVACAITGTIGYFDALIELSGKWDDLKPHVNNDTNSCFQGIGGYSQGKTELIHVNLLFSSCENFKKDFETLKKDVIGINDDGSLTWKWKKTSLGEYFYYNDCHSWKIIEMAFNTKNLKQLVYRHIDQQREKFSRDYERLRTLLNYSLPQGKPE
jgi:hypothetical protein